MKQAGVGPPLKKTCLSHTLTLLSLFHSLYSISTISPPSPHLFTTCPQYFTFLTLLFSLSSSWCFILSLSLIFLRYTSFSPFFSNYFSCYILKKYSLYTFITSAQEKAILIPFSHLVKCVKVVNITMLSILSY